MPFNSENASEYGKKGGRQGFELEQAQLEKMRSILDKDLKIIERLQDAEEINPIDERKLAISQSRVAKYLDKLHIPEVKLNLDLDGGLTKEEKEGLKKLLNKDEANGKTI